MKGRKKLPTEIKQLKGTLRADRQLKDEMKPAKIVDLPYPPEYLNDDGKKEWYNIIKEYHKLGMISKLDLSMLALYCNEISIYIEMVNKLRDKDRVMVFKNPDGSIKYAAQVPYQKIANDALAKALKIASEFGLTPSSRTRISVGQISDNEDPIMQFLKMN